MPARRPLATLLAAVLALSTACAEASVAAAPGVGTSTTAHPVGIGSARGPLVGGVDTRPGRTSSDAAAEGDPAAGAEHPGEAHDGDRADADGPAGRAAPPDARPGGLAAASSPRPGCPSLPPVPDRAAPAALATALAAHLASPAFADTVVGASVWVEGYGEVLAHRPDVPLVVASNQKLLTALGALAALRPEATLRTSVVATGPVVGGVVQGDLVLVGGGDPTLVAHGPHSLAALVDQLLVAGVRAVSGDLVADESRHPPVRDAPGWPDWYTPTYVGPLSALMVEDNRHRWDDAYLAAPAVGNAELLRAVLAGAGVAVAGATRAGTAPDGATTLAAVESPTVAQLVQLMLLDSDNEVAEQLVREAGLASGGDGSTEAGTAAMAEALERQLCVELHEGWSDGSGLSWTDLRSARQLRELVQLAPQLPSWPVVESGLPVAGVSGTLAHRFLGTVAQGNLRAKTGYLSNARSLVGTLRTAGGRDVAFAVVVNGPGAWASVDGIDALVAALAADTS